MGVEHTADRAFSTLSYGEQKRVLIARALIRDPQLLILDEPCTGLDLGAREQFLKSVERLALENDGPTIVFVTHHIEEILPFISHCMLLKEGKVHSQGLTREVLNQANLSDVMDLELELRAENDRFWTALPGNKT